MNILQLRSTALAAALLCALPGAMTSAQAADFTLSGNIQFQKDIVQIDFTLAAPAANVKVWSDSWRSGLNFDPAAVVWSRSASDFALLAAVDDDDSVAPGQGFYDTGFSFNALPAGTYRLTLVAAGNEARGSLLSQGFTYDSQAPIALSVWNQPSYDPNANDQKGGFWRLSFSGVDSVSAVPEMNSAWLLAAGLMALTIALRASKRDR